MADVFISYSRRDDAFVRKLYNELAAHNRDAWVDWEDIPPTAEWLKEVYAGIEAADTFICVLSPDFITSSIGAKELEHAIACKKRLIPIIISKVDWCS